MYNVTRIREQFNVYNVTHIRLLEYGRCRIDVTPSAIRAYVKSEKGLHKPQPCAIILFPPREAEGRAERPREGSLKKWRKKNMNVENPFALNASQESEWRTHMKAFAASCDAAIAALESAVATAPETAKAPLQWAAKAAKDERDGKIVREGERFAQELRNARKSSLASVRKALEAFLFAQGEKKGLTRLQEIQSLSLAGRSIRIEIAPKGQSFTTGKGPEARSTPFRLGFGGGKRKEGKTERLARKRARVIGLLS